MHKLLQLQISTENETSHKQKSLAKQISLPIHPAPLNLYPPVDQQIQHVADQLQVHQQLISYVDDLESYLDPHLSEAANVKVHL